MTKTMKIISILMIAVMLVMVATPVFATNDASTLIDSITIKDPTKTDGMLTILGKVLGILRWIAIIGGTVIIAILGIKYMMGSLEEKAEYKKSLIPLVVGIVVVMGATSIAKLLFDVFTTTT